MSTQHIPTLKVYYTNGHSRAYRLGSQPLTLGRGPECDVVIRDEHISRTHARLQSTRAGYEIRDLHSKNGVYVNGHRVERAILQPGDVIGLGRETAHIRSIRFEVVEKPEAEQNQTHFTNRGHRVDESGSIVLGQLPLADRTPITIGRDPRARVPLDSPVVSRHHARIDPRRDGGHILTDLGSKNGTFVNGRRVTKKHLHSGDIIRVGPYKFLYDPAHLTGYSDQGSIYLDGIKLRREVATRDGNKVILNRVSLSIRPREFVALVGGSGAGKTTLLNALSGADRAQGRVRVNGEDLYRNYDAYRALLGYVPQDDIIHLGLTVEGALRYAARLRLPEDLTEAEIQTRIRQVLTEVDMTAQHDQVINSLSGGQRKRVSIAVELLGNPSLFFLDEPTSGLDPSLEKKMMVMLRKLADGGRTIVLITHATANIEQCDHVVFMAQGRMVFFGPPAEALRFFNLQEFADIYDVINRDPAKWEQRFHKSPLYNRYVRQRLRKAATSTPQPIRDHRPFVNQSSGWRQLLILTQRNLELIWRDHFSLFVQLAVMPLIGLLLLLISGQWDLVGHPAAEIERMLVDDGRYQIVGSSQKLLLMMALAVTLLGIFGAAYEIVKEQVIYARERMINIKILPYVLSKVVSLMIFALLQCGLLILVLATKVKLPVGGSIMAAPLEIYVTLLLTALASICLGLLISATVTRRDGVIYLVLLVLFIQIIFSGAMFDVKGVMKGISYATLTRWSLDALGSTTDLPALNELGKMQLEKPVGFDLEVPEFPEPRVVTETVQMPVELVGGGRALALVPVPHPQEPISRTKHFTKTKTITDEVRATFHIPYKHSQGHLLRCWGVLVFFVFLFGSATCLVQYRKG